MLWPLTDIYTCSIILCQLVVTLTSDQATVTLDATTVAVVEGTTNTVNLLLNLNGATLQTTIVVPVVTAVGGGNPGMYSRR